MLHLRTSGLASLAVCAAAALVATGAAAAPLSPVEMDDPLAADVMALSNDIALANLVTSLLISILVARRT